MAQKPKRPLVFSLAPAYLLAFFFLGIAPAPSSERQERALSAADFAAIVQRVSEDPGFFWNDNYVSNEASYQHPLKKMRELGIEGGIYIGVGPNQNFTYIAKTRPHYAFIVDIRRQNLLEHLLFKALFRFSHSRAEFLSLLLSRPLPPGRFLGESYTVDEMVDYFQSVAGDQELYQKTQARVRQYLSKACQVPLNSEDWGVIDKIHMAFLSRGLGIKYDYIPVPTFGEFLMEKDIDGNRQDFLNSAQEFRYIKRMEAENRIIPITGDFAGAHALKELGALLREWNETVSVFYTSNVEQYLLRNQVWVQFMKNAAELPMDDKTVFVRAYWSDHLMHPELLPGYTFATVLQFAKPFLAAYDPNIAYSYWDIVTMNTIKLHY